MTLFIQLTARNTEVPEPKIYQGEQIVKLRKKMDCSQQVFAEIMGVSSDTISKWERNIRQPQKVACRFLSVLDKEGFEAIK